MRKNFGEGALMLLGPTTSTGAGNSASIKPVQKITAQVVGGGVGSFTIDGSLDAANWTNLVAATTFSVAGITVSSTSLHLVTNLRATLTLNASTAPTTVYVAGR